MRRTPTITAITAIVVALSLAACSDDGDSDSGAGLSEAQGAAASAAIDSAAEDGVTLDESCVNEIAAQLTDEDATLAAAEGSAELSPAGEVLTIELFSCADPDGVIDLFIGGFAEGGPPLDEDCAREQLENVDVVEALVASAEAGQPPQDLIDALTPCFGG